MAITTARTLAIKRQAPTAELETTWKDVAVEDGSPWAVRLVASCFLADTVRNISPTPKLELAVTMFGKHVDAVGELDFDLLNEGWENVLNDAASTCVKDLVRRQVPVPDEFRETLLVSLREARIKAILLVVRYQAASLIHLIPSSEARAIWADEEAKFIMMM